MKSANANAKAVDKHPLEDQQLTAAERVVRTAHSASDVESGMKAVVAMPKATNYVNLKVARYLATWRAQGSPIPAPPFDARQQAIEAAKHKSKHKAAVEAAKQKSLSRAHSGAKTPTEVLPPEAHPPAKVPGSHRTRNRIAFGSIGAVGGFFVGGPIGAVVGGVGGLIAEHLGERA
jgi:hypothetical protein